MLARVAPQWARAHIVLASGSPRRSEILKLMGLEFSVRVSGFAEDLDKSKFAPHAYVMENARIKATRVHAEQKETPHLTIGADTVVVLGEQIIEKPASKSDAVRILSDLSGRTHRVVTGVALVVGPKDKPQVRQFYETTEVTFATLSRALIEAYVESGEPMDKAGAYGNQGMGGALVEGIRGCYWNVVGLPMHRLFFELTELRPVA